MGVQGKRITPRIWFMLEQLKGRYLIMEQRDTQPADKKLGSLIRFYRVTKKLSQEKLADHLGISFQQVQKYEKGVNRIGAARLMMIAQFLEVSTNTLLGIEDGSEVNKLVDNTEVIDFLSTQGGLRLVHSFMQLSVNRRYVVVRLVEELVGTTDV
jgi:transcriptional regulator with XRE-family HTH domain